MNCARWKVEQLHRETKQLTEIKKCQDCVSHVRNSVALSNITVCSGTIHCALFRSFIKGKSFIEMVLPHKIMMICFCVSP